MTDKAHTGRELSVLILDQMINERWYLGSEVYDLLLNSGKLNTADLELHKGGNETKSYRRTQNALRDLAKGERLERNKFSSSRYQYRIPN